MKQPEYPWCLIVLYDPQGRVVAQERDVRWPKWPGIIVSGERYFCFGRNEGHVGHYYERTVHFLPQKRRRRHA